MITINKHCEIYVDITNMLSQHFISGIQRVVREGTKRLILMGDSYGWKIRLLQWVEQKRAYRVLDNNKYLVWLKDSKNMNLWYKEWMLLPEQIPSKAIFFDVDSVWPNTPKRSYLFSILKKRNVKIAALIHDIIPITHPQFFPIDIQNEFPQYIDAELAYADLIFTTTEFVRGEIQNLIMQMGHKMPQFKLAPLGSDFINCARSDPEIDTGVKRIAKEAPYLLTVATIEARKNHKVILDAYDHCLKNTNINIIFAGRVGWGSEELMKRILTHPKFGKRIFLFNDKNNKTISYLYQKALYTVFPTYVEGFGLPAVESLIAGTPVLLSDIPVLHEIAGDYAEYFDPNLPEALSNLVIKGLSDLEDYAERKRHVASYRPTTWDKFGNSLINGMLALIE